MTFAQNNPPEGLPASVHTEVAILGAMLLDAVAVQDATAKLDAEDFSLDSNQRVFKAMLSLQEDGTAIDLRTVMARLERRRELDSIGGPAYLASLTEDLPRNYNLPAYIQIVRDKALLRKLMGLFYDAQIRAGDQGEDGYELFKDVEERLAELAASGLRIRKDRKVLVGATDFTRETMPDVEWAVDGLIQRGGNGVIVGDPKVSKSFAALDLAHHLAAGVPWMGHDIPRRMKVAYVSREDHAGLTQHRALSLMNGYDGTRVGFALNEINLNEWLYYNTRAQTETFSLQNDMDVQEIIDSFTAAGIEIAFFDVFRRLWTGDENDNKQVAKVLDVLSQIQAKCKCSIGLIHHVNKGGDGTIFQRIRGASAIFGWIEWGFGISVDNPDEKQKVRKVVFETKAATSAEPIYYRLDGNNVDKVELALCTGAEGHHKPANRDEAIPWWDQKQ